MTVCSTRWRPIGQRTDVSTTYFQGLLEEGNKRDLEWFFDDWVYRDRGLPEFRVENAYMPGLARQPQQDCPGDGDHRKSRGRGR